MMNETAEAAHLMSGKSRQRREPSSLSGLFRPSDSLLLAFFVPILVLLVIFAARGIWPFGDECFLRLDMYHQYTPFMEEFRDKLRSGGSLLYTWDTGLGANFVALYAYYLASPLNWLVFLCPHGLVIEFVTAMVVLKTALSGLTFAWYLQRHTGRKRFGAGLFGVFYALSGFMCAYSWNIMWLDCIWLFPLIVLGLEELVREQKPFLYCITLGLSILSNYYISIMICIFLVIYFPIVCFLNYENKRKLGESAAWFALFSLHAGALAAVLLLPEVMALQSTAAAESAFPKTFQSYFPVIDMLARHMCGVESETGLDHWPNIYCGTAVYIFFVLYLLDGKISRREKLAYCTLEVFFLASFSINFLNFIWHGFHYPNSLPARQSFIYIFILLLMCYEAFTHLRTMPAKNIGPAFAAAVCFVLLAQKLVTDDAFEFWVYYLALALLLLYTALLYLAKKEIKKEILYVAAVLLVIVETVANTAIISVPTTSREAYVRQDDSVALLMEGRARGNEFVRVDYDDEQTKNYGAWSGYHSASVFSSLSGDDMSDFYKKVGCEGGINSYCTNGSTPLIDSLFSVRYTMKKRVSDNPNMHMVQEAGQLFLYENPFVLPIGFAVPDRLLNEWEPSETDPVKSQNDFAELLGAGMLLEAQPFEENGTNLTFTADEGGEYYINVTNHTVKKASLLRMEFSDTLTNMTRGFLVETGYIPQGITVTLDTEEPQGEALRGSVYRFNYDTLERIHNTLSPGGLKVTEWKDSRIKGDIRLEEEQTVFFSIPYDEGWSVTIDGKSAIMDKVFGAFCGVKVPAGDHTLELRYMPDGLLAGLVISLMALGVLAAALAAANRRPARKTENTGTGNGGGLEKRRTNMKKERLEDYVLTIPDFPEPGIMFRDITTILQDGDGLAMAVDGLADAIEGLEIDAVLGPEARGFIFGVPVAYKLHKGFIPVRKKGKLPRETVSIKYDLEYGSAELEIHKDAIRPGMKVAVVDDLMATGGTMAAIVHMVEEMGGEVVKLCFVMELAGLKGREKLAGYDITSLITYEGK